MKEENSKKIKIVRKKVNSKEFLDHPIILKNKEDIELYNKMKEQLKLNLKDDIESKIERMKILYEIKQKGLYQYDGFSSFDQFIKQYVIAKSQAYTYLRIYESVLNGIISIDYIKEMGFKGTYKHIKKQESLHQKNLLNKEIDKEEDNDNMNSPIRILMKNKEVYYFAKQDTKRLYFIIEELYLNNKDFLFNIISKYEEQKRKKKQNK